MQMHEFQIAPLAASHVSNFPFLWRIYARQSCAGVVCAASHNMPHPSRPKIALPVVWLVPSAQSFDAAIPDRVRARLEQALETLSSPSASIMTSASAVDLMLKHLNYKSGSLYARIDAAVNDHRITEDMAAWAHDVRLDVNDERHADENAPEPTSSDAERCLEFAHTLAEILFVLPARVRRGRAQDPPKT
jgi:hypothetical protein